jgi:hypothetical protein
VPPSCELLRLAALFCCSNKLCPVAPLQGVILYGEPGTGKTLLAKAVANSTSATFLRVVGSELIQKYLGDGPKLVRELFRVADELSPSIVFIGAIRVGFMVRAWADRCLWCRVYVVTLTVACWPKVVHLMLSGDGPKLAASSFRSTWVTGLSWCGSCSEWQMNSAPALCS